MIALAAGIALAIVTIISIKWSNNENSAWGYPLVLASLPTCYIGFALYADDSEALLPEILHGLPFYVLALRAAFKPAKLLTALLAIAFIWHGIYDFIHPWLFTNKGTPSWWDVFCGSVDFVIGAYLLAVVYFFNNHSKA